MDTMTYEFTFPDDGGAVEIVVTGTAVRAGFDRLDAELVADPRWTPGRPILVDLRGLSFDDFSNQDTRDSANFVQSLAGDFGAARCALVVQRDVDFGIARMFEIMTTDATRMVMRVFRSIDEARGWLEDAD